MRRKTLINILSVLLFSLVFFILYECKMQPNFFAVTSSVNYVETVIIDAGHGGEDGGAVGKNGAIEKEVNLAVSNKIECILNLFGVNTDMIRREDTSLGEVSKSSVRRRKVSDIKKRVEIIRNTPNATLISVHQNSFPQDSKCKGAQVFYSENNLESAELAEMTQLALKKGIDVDNKREAKAADSGIYLLNNVNCPAILVECGFLTNPDEVKLLMSDGHRTKLALSIVSGFLQFKD